MPDENGENDQLPVRATYVESASGTTNPDNANSGGTAYVVAAIAIVLLMVVSSSVTSCSKAMLEGLARGYSDGYGLTYDTQGQDTGDFEQMIREYLETQDEGESDDSMGPGSSAMSVTDALDQDLSVYSTTIDDGVSANAYSGVPSAVRSFVRSVVTTDSDATTEVIRHLRAAAREGADTTAEIEAAIETARHAAADIDALEYEGVTDDELSSALNDAREEAVGRWDSIVELLDVLDTDDEVSVRDLAKADASVTDATDDAAQALTDALELAAR